MEKEKESAPQKLGNVLEQMREKGKDIDFANLPERTEEEKRISAIKAQARKNIIAAANRYMTSRERPELEYIQGLVDELDDAFVLMVGQKDGIPYSITFNPRTPVPEDPTAK